MRLNKLFIGNIYTLIDSNFKYGPYFAPLSLARPVYHIKFKKRTLLYKKADSTFIDLSMVENKTELKNSNNIVDIQKNEDFVMVDDNLICFENALLKHNIKRKHISNNFVKKLTQNFK